MQPSFTTHDKKAIFFDLHDTLVNKELGFREAFAEALNEFTARWDNGEWNAGRAVERYAREWSKPVTAVKGKRPKRASCNPFDQKRMDCLRKSLIGSPLPVTDSFLRVILKRVKELVPIHPRLFPDVRETLEKLHAHYQLAIVSNGSRERLEATLERSGLQPLFSNGHIFVPAARALRKPHPDLFEKALSAMSISPSEAVMVGNSWKNDIFGANRCGIDAIWIRHNNKKTVQRKIGKNRVIFIHQCKQLLQLFETD